MFLQAYAVRSAKDVPQAEAKGKPAAEAPMTPSAWKGTQVCQLYSLATNICEFALYTLLALVIKVLNEPFACINR